MSKRTGIGWAWEFQDINGEWQICNWSEPFKTLLDDDEFAKPCSEARKIRVELIPTSKRNRKRYGIPVLEDSK